MTTAILCERGQVTIPKQFRTKLGLEPGMVLSFCVEGKALKVTVQRPKRNPFREAYGCLRGAFDGHRTDDVIREMRGC
jgi:bifunctional DNA-binding transcriptional regulator/antitoxin component of YhaV-PrlF toxin-antitoxin module